MKELAADVLDDFDRLLDHLIESDVDDALAGIALYRFVPDIDTVFVLSIRAERDTGLHRPR